MNKEQKLRLAEMVLDFVELHQDADERPVRMVGVTNGKKTFSLQGFKPVGVGTPVFDTGRAYMIMFESLDGKRNVEVTYDKDQIKEGIDFKDIG